MSISKLTRKKGARREDCMLMGSLSIQSKDQKEAVNGAKWGLEVCFSKLSDPRIDKKESLPINGSMSCFFKRPICKIFHEVDFV